MQPCAQNIKLERSQLDVGAVDAWLSLLTWGITYFLEETSNFQSIHAYLPTVVQPDKR